jgi:hypothetical protein
LSRAASIAASTSSIDAVFLTTGRSFYRHLLAGP